MSKELELKIDYDADMGRHYIPVATDWEIQTRGNGSSFRIANAKTEDRWLITDKHLHAMLETMARDINAEIVGLKTYAATLAAERDALAKELEKVKLERNAFQDQCISLKHKVAIKAQSEPVADGLRGFSLWLDRESWGHVIDGLILERERSEQRKAANADSNSNVIADRCAELIGQINKASESAMSHPAPADKDGERPCSCDPLFLLMYYSGGAAPEGYQGRIIMKVGNKAVDYLRVEGSERELVTLAAIAKEGKS